MPNGSLEYSIPNPFQHGRPSSSRPRRSSVEEIYRSIFEEESRWITEPPEEEQEMPETEEFRVGDRVRVREACLGQDCGAGNTYTQPYHSNEAEIIQLTRYGGRPAVILQFDEQRHGLHRWTALVEEIEHVGPQEPEISLEEIMEKKTTKKQKYMSVDLKECEEGYEVTMKASPAFMPLLEEFQVGQAMNTEVGLSQDWDGSSMSRRKLIKTAVSADLSQYGVWMFSKDFLDTKTMTVRRNSASRVSQVIDSITNDVGLICRAAEVLRPRGIYAVITEEEEEGDDSS